MAYYGDSKWAINYKYTDSENRNSQTINGLNLINDWSDTASSLGYTGDQAYNFAKSLVSLAGSTWEAADVYLSQNRSVIPTT